MTVHNLDVVRTVIPLEADAPLVVDPNAVLPAPVALEGLKPVCGRDPKVVQPRCCIELQQLAPSDTFKTGKCPDELVVEQPLRVLVGEAPDHSSIYAASGIPPSGIHSYAKLTLPSA
jgi:hypothetical protein